MIAEVQFFLKRKPFLSVVLFSGLIGAALGLSNATWQVTVETGQALAGVVKYPPNSPFYMYHLKVFTIINQISAVLLRLTDSERFVSILVSGFLGMLSFQAIAVLIFAINRNIYMSILGVVFIYFTDHVGDGVVYPIWFLGYQHTYGILGLAFAILVIALLGAKAYRWGLFCLGLAPCVHPSLGLWVVLMVCLSALFDVNFAKKILKTHYLYFAAGLCIAVASLTYQLILMQDLQVIDPEIKKQYLDSFVKYWDSHRKPFYWDSVVGDTHFRKWGIFFCLYSVISGCLGIKLLKKNSSVTFLFRVIVLSGILSLSLGIITQLPPEKIPSYLLMFMPSRYVNLNNMVLSASLLGVLTVCNNKKYITNYNIFVLFLLCSFFTRHAEVWVIVFAVILGWFALLAFKESPLIQARNLFSTRTHRVSYKKLLLIFMIVFFLINLPRPNYVHRFLYRPGPLKDRTNDEFYSLIADREGLLLTTHYSPMVTLRTRRPILVDMASPNCFTYTPESAIVFNNVLTKIYGVDLLTPPPIEYRHKEIRPELYKALWEKRTVRQWQHIQSDFGITDILTPSDWQLSLPVIAKSKTDILYHVPRREPGLSEYY